MRKSIFIFVLMGISAFTFGQIKVTNNGSIGIGTSNPQHKLEVSGEVYIDSQISDWAKALWIKVHSQYACAYNLWNTTYNKDVFYVCGDGYSWSLKGSFVGSDSLMKRNIKPMLSSLNTIKKLNGVRYRYKNECRDDRCITTDTCSSSISSDGYRLGLIAQDVEKIVPEVVKTMFDGSKAIAYTDLIALLIEGIKEQQIQIETVQSLLYSQEQEIVELRESIKDILSIINEQPTLDTRQRELSGIFARLYNNSPNPFTISTNISFYVPHESKQAAIYIYDMNSKQIKIFPLIMKGDGTITISDKDLSPGMYFYTLVVDNEVISTKKMIFTEK